MEDYVYNVIYNNTPGLADNDTEDSELALKFVEYLVSKITGWGHKGYYAERDLRLGQNIFDELFKIVEKTEKTIVVITPGFRDNYWAKYSGQSAFLYLMNENHQDKIIPIALNIADNQSLREFNVNGPLHIEGLTDDVWEGNQRNSRRFVRLEKTLQPLYQQTVNEDTGDNRLRTEVQQQFVTRPASETSLPSVGTSNADQLHINNHSISDSLQSVVIYEQSMSEPRIHSVELQPHLDCDGDTSSVDTEVPSEVTSDRLPIEDDPTTRRTAMSTLVSISDDKDLSMDVMPSVSESQGTDRAVQQISFVARPETLGAEDMTDTRPDIVKLSLRSFEEDIDSEVSDQSQTVPKLVLQSESGYTTLSDDTPSSSAEADLFNQTDDAESSAPTPSQSDQLRCSDTSNVERSDKSTGSDLGENGTELLSRIGMFIHFFLIVTEFFGNIDKAYSG